MASIEEIECSIQQYELQVRQVNFSRKPSIYCLKLFDQLSQVDEALKVANETEQSSLSNLRSDLQELLDLTRETLNEQQKESSAEGASTNDDDDPFAQEMALFMAEMNEKDARNSTDDNAEATLSDELLKFKVFSS